MSKIAVNGKNRSKREKERKIQISLLFEIWAGIKPKIQSHLTSREKDTKREIKREEKITRK